MILSGFGLKDYSFLTSEPGISSGVFAASRFCSASVRVAR